MADETPDGTKTPRKPSEARAERLKAALRDNLRRRKAQVRGRLAAPDGPEEPAESDAQA